MNNLSISGTLIKQLHHIRKKCRNDFQKKKKSHNNTKLLINFDTEEITTERGPCFIQKYYNNNKLKRIRIYLFEQIIWAQFEHKYIKNQLNKIKKFPQDIVLLIKKYIGFNQIIWKDSLKKLQYT